MSEIKTIVCTKCGAKVETNGSGDFTTFVCDACAEKRNLNAYKAEVREKNTEKRLPSYDKRVAFLKKRIAKVEEAIEAEAEAK